ncbi:NAD-dependent epimerase/dehydratase family protein [Klebsiella grimontii]|uniref:NAD-dependent epimerase/dehydratase family protein n=1 Tax=Klebsiella grimontii TaxID=2058152 RepID=UPI002244931D|nr:NAD(P)-dependent oxidoreductase [Klebsiella grimontii]
MRILITGSSGFVGVALSEHLLAAGIDVVGYDLNPVSAQVLMTFSALPGRFYQETGDVGDSGTLRNVMSQHRPQQVVTLAAITADAIRERLTPQIIFEVNVGGVLAVIDAAVHCSVSRLLHISSGSVYGASGRMKGVLNESETLLAPEGLYGMSKRAAEEAAQRLATLHGLPLTIARLGTCFGPWETDTGVRDTLSAPLQLLTLARSGVNAILPRDSHRDWLYVRDAAEAISCLLNLPEWKSGLYNLAAGFEWPLSKWCHYLQMDYPEFTWHVAQEGEAPNIDLYADYDRSSMSIQRLLGGYQVRTTLWSD